MKNFEGICSKVDITKLKETEDAFKKIAEKYRLILENMTDLIGILDINGYVMYVSPSVKAVLGYSPQYYVGKNGFDNVHPDEMTLLMERFKNMFKKREPTQAEFRFLHKNGNWLLLEVSWIPIIGENGDVQHVILVGRDITEKRKTEELLLKSEKLAIAGEISAGVAHEIRNPLTTVKGFIHLFEQGIIKKEYFDIVSNELNRIDEIINQFLSLAKPQPIRPKLVDIKMLLKEVKRLLELEPEVNFNNVQIKIKCPKNTPTIKCDPNQMKQVFINLVKNSIDATPTGGYIEINIVIEGEYMVIKVRDNGVGISKERIPKLGEPFFSNKEKGIGLGLTFCFRIIRQHNGTFLVQSKENQGTTIEIRLPI